MLRPCENRKAVEGFLAFIETGISPTTKKSYSEVTKQDFRILPARFWRWLLKEDEDDPDPPCVRWLKRKRGGVVSRFTRPEKQPTPDEVETLIERGDIHPGDKAMFALAYESGLSAKELLTLRWKHVQADRLGLVLMVEGAKEKGARRVRVPLCDAIPKLNAWRRLHPRGEETEAPAFVEVEGGRYGLSMNYAAARKALKDGLARAGLRSTISWHGFRHERATQLAGKVTGSHLEMQMGWVHGSRVAARYIHLNGKDQDKAICRAYGMRVGQEEPEGRAVPKNCPRCGDLNEADKKYCGNCGGALTTEEAMRMDELEERISAAVLKHMDDKEFRKRAEARRRSREAKA